jgi:hypothetical protein
MESKKIITNPKKRSSLRKQNKSDLLDNIINEYCLKRNSFHPSNPSPNIFIGKLEIRMKKYYNNLYRSIRE